ncbi:16S rRNA (guanine(527)-N(7))-methyltransferase RsmG [Brachybacterium hainanense]|uniref:Ribosomal RNA small subunit methyltransferase G n=1 Tax=Brachybacterium hainanense TaxID=1541174 RepID=A0ABV6RD74_9MICO
MPGQLPDPLRPLAERLFAGRLPLAERYTALLAEAGPERGLIGPREVDRLWERHVLGCALLVEAIGPQARTLADVGSGAGLPGVVVAIARPDLQVTLIETMQRRVTWLEEVDAELGLGMEIIRARAEELHGTRTFDVVTARAVAALDKLARWTLPLVAEGGELAVLKGSKAAEEIEQARSTLRKLGGGEPRIEIHGGPEVEVPTTVVRVQRRAAGSRKGDVRG